MDPRTTPDSETDFSRFINNCLDKRIAHLKDIKNHLKKYWLKYLLINTLELLFRLFSANSHNFRLLNGLIV